MIVVQPIATTQTISFYAREHSGTSYTVDITNEETQAKDQQTVSGTFEDGMLTIDIIYPFIEGRFYMIETYAGSDLINMSKIYATAQASMPKYTVLDGYYTTPPESDNEYIVKPTQ